MTEQRRVIIITPGIPTTGLWCDTCMRSSGLEVPLHLVSDTGITRIGTARVCADCGEPIIQGEEDKS